MPADAPHTLLNTVGTSLFYPNLSRLDGESESPEHRALAEAYARHAWDDVALALAAIDPADRLCGAEINSIDSLLRNGYAAPEPRLRFYHSDTDDGRAIAAVLTAYYRLQGLEAEARCIDDLQDGDPNRFRTRGLRNLAKALCADSRNFSPAACAINATGGYKAQIAVAVMLGQALGIPVYYKHERFDAIIAFPPMPIAFDMGFWMEVSGVLYDLAAAGADPVSQDQYDEPWPEQMDALVDRIDIDGVDYLELTPAGQIFHDTFSQRFARDEAQLLPPAVDSREKKAPTWENSGHMRSHPEVQRFMERITAEIPQVSGCSTVYYNPRLPQRTRFHVTADGLRCTYSNKQYTIRIAVKSRAQTPAQEKALAARLNRWLQES